MLRQRTPVRSPGMKSGAAREAADPATLAADPGSTAAAYTGATASESYSYSVKAVQDGERSQASGEAVVQLPPGRPTPERLT